MDGFDDFAAGDELLSGEVGERASKFEDTIVGLGGEIHLLHRGIDGKLGDLETLNLDFAGAGNALTNRCGGSPIRFSEVRSLRSTHELRHECR